MSRRTGPPGRETAVAASTERRSWYGYGSITRIEKSRFGRLLNDATRIYAEVALFGLPILLYIMDAPAAGWFDAKATGLVALVTMTVVGTLIRTGTIRPLATQTDGWVTLTPWLLVLRAVYFNVALVIAIFGGVAVGTFLGSWPGGLLWAGAVSTVAMLAFPRCGQTWLQWVRAQH